MFRPEVYKKLEEFKPPFRQTKVLKVLYEIVKELVVSTKGNIISIRISEISEKLKVKKTYNPIIMQVVKDFVEVHVPPSEIVEMKRGKIVLTKIGAEMLLWALERELKLS